MNCCNQCQGIEDLFNQKVAEDDLRDYHKNGPPKQTRLLLDTLRAAGIEGLTLAPATPALAGAEVELVPMMAREFRLKRAIDALRGSFDYILIDCPPSLGLLTVNALTAADEVIVPVQCEYLALEGLSQLTATLELVRRNLNSRLRLRGLLLTMFDGRTNLSQQVADEVRSHFANTFKTVIPRSVRLSEAPSHGLPIARYDPSSRASKAYDELAEELIAGSRAGVLGVGG